MTNLADLAEQLFWAHEYITNPEAQASPWGWEPGEDVLAEVSRLSQREKATLLDLSLDLSVQFARTLAAVLRWDAVGAVVHDAAGRGWETRTERSQRVRPTLEAIPVDQVLLPWALDDSRSHPQSVHPSCPEEAEAYWRRLMSEEPQPGDEDMAA